MTLSYARLSRWDDAASRIVSAHVTQGLPGDVTAFVSAYADLDRDEAYGVFAGVSVPLGEAMSASADMTLDKAGAALGAEIARAERSVLGSYGWRARVSEDEQAARASYRADFVRLEGAVWNRPSGVYGSVQAEGAVTLAGGGLFLSPRIDDAFAIVETGVPGVAVTLENRPAGVTDSDGQLLLTGLRAWEPNRVTIDPDGLPVGADVTAVVREIVPEDRGGAVADFTVTEMPAAALVTLRRADGAFVPAGAAAVLEASGEAFVVGYEGEVYVTGLAASNRLIVALPDGGRCAAAFAFARDGAGLVRIGDVTCGGDGAAR